MNRAPVVALLATGCALAAAAAGTGPYLTTAPVEYAQLRGRVFQLPGVDQSEPEPIPEFGAWERWLDRVLLALVAAGVLYVLYRGVRALLGLLDLRFLTRRAPVTDTDEYDPGDESHADAVTALRQRVAHELTALSADLAEDVDAREVVIACYARMERTLAEAGSARRVDEAPMELLARVLAEQHVPAADVRRLTALFTEARFSTHPVTGEMRDAARRSLRNIADALAVPA